MNGKVVVRQLFDEVLNEGRLDLIDELLSDDYLDHNPLPGVPPGAAGVKIKVKALRGAFPDIRFELEEIVAEGSLVAARYRWRGTQEGSFGDIPPAGKTVEVTGMDFYRLEQGKIVEHWHNIDELGLLRQLGAVKVGRA